MSTVWTMLDFLDESKCFQNGLTGQPASMEAYMTVIDYTLLVPALKQMKSNYSKAEWQELYDDLMARAYISPINKLTANEIKRTILDGWKE